MRFSVVRLKPDAIKYFMQDTAGRGFIGRTGDTQASANVLFDTEWDLHASGSLLLMHKKGAPEGETYVCPMADVALALVAAEPEEKKAAKPGKAAAQ